MPKEQDQLIPLQFTPAQINVLISALQELPLKTSLETFSSMQAQLQEFQRKVSSSSSPQERAAKEQEKLDALPVSQLTKEQAQERAMRAGAHIPNRADRRALAKIKKKQRTGMAANGAAQPKA